MGIIESSQYESYQNDQQGADTDGEGSTFTIDFQVLPIKKIVRVAQEQGSDISLVKSVR